MKQSIGTHASVGNTALAIAGKSYIKLAEMLILANYFSTIFQVKVYISDKIN